MIDRRFLMAGMGACSLLAMNATFFSDSVAWAVPSAIKAFDKDNDGTLDVAEVKEAAGKLFDKLDKAGDGTLDSKEVGTRVTKADFKAVDVDHDGMLTNISPSSKSFSSQPTSTKMAPFRRRSFSPRPGWRFCV
jgi:EF hand